MLGHQKPIEDILGLALDFGFNPYITRKKIAKKTEKVEFFYAM
jgi:hypothetical protein